MLAAVACLFSGCGGGTTAATTKAPTTTGDESAVLTWKRVRSCLADNGISNFDGVPPTGPYEPPRVMPLNFSDAPGGWFVAYMSGGQELQVFFYGDAVEAERAERDASSAPYAGPVGTRGNVIHRFRERPTMEQARVLESCVPVPANS